MSHIGAIWVYLAASPLLGLTLTLFAYLFAQALYARSNYNPLANPVLIAVAVVVIVLLVTGTPYPTYFQGAQFVHFLLGPATVALALPLYRQLPKLRRTALPLAGGLVAGSLTAIVSATGIAMLFGASPATVASLAPKSATTPIAMAIAERLGGLPSLTAVLVICTGVFGAGVGTHHPERVADRRGRGSRLRAGRGIAWYRHGARLPGQRGNGRVRRARHGLERPVHGVYRAGPVTDRPTVVRLTSGIPTQSTRDTLMQRERLGGFKNSLMVRSSWRCSHLLGPRAAQAVRGCFSYCSSLLRVLGALSVVARQAFLLRDRVMHSFHVRYSVIAASVIALAGLFQFQLSIAGEPMDHGIYSPIPFSFKADRGIFSEVPRERADPRIVSPVSQSQGVRVLNVSHGRARIRHDL